MRRHEVIELLRAHRAEIDAFGVKSLALFGSVARDEARPDSDVDVLVEFDGPTRFRAHVGLIVYLEELLGRRVDVATAAMLPSEIVESIASGLVPIV